MTNRLELALFLLILPVVGVFLGGCWVIVKGLEGVVVIFLPEQGER